MTTHFVEFAKKTGAQLTFADYADEMHAFDTLQSGEASAKVIQDSLDWMQEQFKH